MEGFETLGIEKDLKEGSQWHFFLALPYDHTGEMLHPQSARVQEGLDHRLQHLWRRGKAPRIFRLSFAK